MLEELINIFEKANEMVIINDNDLFTTGVSERTLCGALMLHLHEVLKETRYRDYYVDVEYNRNRDGKLKTINKTISGHENKIIRINCDLIVHSRGHNVFQDNLIAIEMKKSNQPKRDKDSDRERLIALTKEYFDDIWSVEGKALPEHVCRYKLGIFYEINYGKKQIMLEYYVNGKFYIQKEASFRIKI
ncbi:hypothetical protein DVW05_06030 [Clostridium botulinum]|nr:hypothetical protein [Clostridium botulinum]